MLPRTSVKTRLHTVRSLPPLALVLYALLPGLITGCEPPAEQEVQWEFLHGPYAREITTLLSLEQTRGHLLVGMVNGDVFFSASNGESWIRRTPPSPGMTIHTFVQHPDTPGSIYACAAGGLFLSRDEARSWRQLLPADTSQRQSVRCLAIDPWKTLTFFAGTEGNGILQSTDDGMTWTSANGVADSLLRGAVVYAIRIDPDRPDRMLAALGTGGLALSEDGAAQWRLLVGGATTVAAAITHVVVESGNGSMIVYGTSAGSVFRSTNLGAHWSPSREALTGERIRSLMADPSHARQLLAGSESGLLISTDFGGSWRGAGQSLPPTATSLALGPGTKPAWYVYGPALGLQLSSDEGRTWSAIDNHLGGMTARVITTDPLSHDVVVASGPILLKTTPGETRWIPLTSGLAGGDITSCAFDRHQRGSIYVTTGLGSFSSQDGGITWQACARPLPSPPTLIIPHPWFSSRLLGSSANGNFYSTDRGTTWRECRPLMRTPPARSFTFRPTDAGAVYAGAGTRGVLLSSDGGISWDVTRFGLDQDTIEFISLDSQDKNVCYAWTSRARCYRSLNGGLEWGRYSAPWETGDEVLLAIDPFSPSDVVALANGRTFYVSTDGGTTWTRVLERRLPASPVSISWNRHTGSLLAGTRHGGVYRIDLSASVRASDPGREV